MSASKVLVGCWLGLALLSITTVLLGSAGSTLLLGGTILLVALGVIALVSFIVARSIREPLVRLILGTGAVAQGNLDVRLRRAN